MTLKNRFMYQGLAVVVFSAMLQSYACSALCASDVFTCCGESEQETATIADGCHHDQDHEARNNDCQQEHSAFMFTIGQFHGFDNVSLSKVLQPEMDSRQLPIFSIVPLDHQADLVYTGFHPPPPKEDILLLLQHFLI